MAGWGLALSTDYLNRSEKQDRLTNSRAGPWPAYVAEIDGRLQSPQTLGLAEGQRTNQSMREWARWVVPTSHKLDVMCTASLYLLGGSGQERAQVISLLVLEETRSIKLGECNL
jgi:hypothetical protein